MRQSFTLQSLLIAQVMQIITIDKRTLESGLSVLTNRLGNGKISLDRDRSQWRRLRVGQQKSTVLELHVTPIHYQGHTYHQSGYSESFQSTRVNNRRPKLTKQEWHLLSVQHVKFLVSAHFRCHFQDAFSCNSWFTYGK